jgi:hypothetical protein
MGSSAPITSSPHHPLTTMTTNTLEKLNDEIVILETRLAHKRRLKAQLQAETQGFIWEEISDRILLLHDPQRRNGWSYLTYLGFRTKADAEKCLSFLLKSQAAAAVEGPRAAERVAVGKWELKILDLNPEALAAIARKQAQAEALAA